MAPDSDNSSQVVKTPEPRLVYSTPLGMMVHGKAEEVFRSKILRPERGKAQLIFTSPPFPLNRKKRYGNHVGDEYVKWLSAFAPRFIEFLKRDGSIAVELGNSWVQRAPAMSTLALRALLEFVDRGDLFLCQQFVCANPSRLPSPAQWVNVERIRVKDAFTHIWWMAPTDRPKADNRRVLEPYSTHMQKLLKTQKYNAGRRPSEHSIGSRSFLTDNGGAIPPNVIEAANTRASDPYLNYCRQHDITPHPARMPLKLAEFFIKFLTEPGDLIIDPFAGSNVTGYVAESLGRRWISIEAESGYADASAARFTNVVMEGQSGLF